MSLIFVLAKFGTFCAAIYKKLGIAADSFQQLIIHMVFI